jgi:hypothetical protein
LNYQQLPAGGSNIGVTAFNARRSKVDKWDVFVRVAGTEQQTAADVELLQDGVLLGEETVVLERGESQRLVFSVNVEKASRLEARLKPDGFDSLAADNVAFLELSAGRPLSVYSHLEMTTYRHALQTLKGVDLFPKENVSGNASSYDVLITNRKQDEALDATVSLFVGIIPDDLQELVSLKTGLAEIVDWQRSAPLLQHVQLSGIQIIDEPSSADGIRDGHYEELGYEILAHTRSGPLILKKRTGERLAFYLLFDTDRSTFPYRVGFPILIANVVQIALQQAELSEARGRPAGVLPPKSLEPNQSYQITAPDGSRHDVESNADGIVSGVPAPLVGSYVVSQEGKEVTQIGVSLLNKTETSLVGVAKIQFRELSVTASETQIESDHPLWPTFAFLAFGLLLVEWWFFQRRPGGVST